MLEEVINIIKDVSLRHKAVNDFHYQDNLLTNAQNNHKYYQVIVDDTNYHQLLISYNPNIFTATFDIYVLGFVDTDNTILNVQSNAYDIALQIMWKIQSIDEYDGIIDVHDYSIVTLSHYTDDNCAGVKMTLELRLPFGFCENDENFDDEPTELTDYINTKDITLNIDSNKSIDKPITLNPVRLKP